MKTISLRSLQHYMYCPHRWGLIEIEQAWAENYFVVRANLMHDRAHSALAYTKRGRKVHTAVSVWNDDYDIYGVTDCIEVAESGEMIIVEYKPSKPENCEYNHDDAMQVYAQKLCVDSVFGTDCSCEVYYADVKRRVSLPFDDREVSAHFEAQLQEILSQMRERISAGKVPPVQRGQNCNGCSMKNMCMPKVRRNVDMRTQIIEFAQEDL